MDIIGLTDDGEVNGMMRKHILHMIKEFSDEGHSGFSANYAINLLSKLLRFEPLSPLTGEDSEWNQIGYDEELWFQNKRCSHVFKDKDGRAYDSQGRVFTETCVTEDGEEFESSYTSSDSRVYIEFPYVPKTEYIHVGRRN